MKILIITSFLAFISSSSAGNIFCIESGGVEKLSGNSCDQPILHGPRRYAYNKDIRKCQSFVPGCMTNTNNFNSMEECQNSCQVSFLSDLGAGARMGGGGDLRASDICELPLKTGICLAHLTRYGYDPKQEQCVKFVYGGCMGNENNFNTKQECDNVCQNQPFFK